jgi:hypothetical protein
MLTVPQILAWCDTFKPKIGSWPKMYSGPVAGQLEENWRRVDNALRYGLCGLDQSGGSSLADLLTHHRAVRNVHRLPRLTDAEILRWAKHHREATGAWPNENPGPVVGPAGEVWANVNAALRDGGRSLAGGSSLAKLLATEFGVRTKVNIPA